jgi:hypothetical protein
LVTVVGSGQVRIVELVLVEADCGIPGVRPCCRRSGAKGRLLIRKGGDSVGEAKLRGYESISGEMVTVRDKAGCLDRL